MNIQEKNMDAKEIIIVSVCTLVIFITGMFAGYMVPKCHGPKGFGQVYMMGGGCQCGKKMMKHDKGFGCDKPMGECGCDKMRDGKNFDKMKKGSMGERMGRGEGRGPRPAPKGAPMAESVGVPSSEPIEASRP